MIAPDISTASLDTANLLPMVADACEALEAAGVTDKPAVVLADAGYWKNSSSTYEDRDRSSRSSVRSRRIEESGGSNDVVD